MEEWEANEQKYSLVRRSMNACGLRTKVKSQISDDGEEGNEGGGGGAFTFVKAEYQPLESADVIVVKADVIVAGVVKAINVSSSTMRLLHEDRILATFQGAELPEQLFPGRGQQVADVPMIQLIGQADPYDVTQGSVGDCWLLSAISSLAEYEGAISRLFARTKNNTDDDLPFSDQCNTYTVTLYDVSEAEMTSSTEATGDYDDVMDDDYKEVHVTVTEALSAKGGGESSSGTHGIGRELLGCAPSIAGELWPCYVEKAVAVLCGGWDNIHGGTCTHAWRLLTG